MRQKTSKNLLLLKIAHCGNVKRYFDGKNSPCKTVVEYQKKDRLDFCIPEPWSGHLEKAPILFISSNPSISEKRSKSNKEVSSYPLSNKEWDNKRTKEYFTGRFEKWIKDGIYPLKKDGKPCKQWSRYWASAKARSCELLQKSKKEVKPGKDYALTEIVHCKTKKEANVEEQIWEICAKKYLDKILEVALKVKVIVCTGKKASDVIREKFRVCNEKIVAERAVGGRNIYFVCMPHISGYRGKRTFKNILCKSDFEKLKKVLQKQ